ncbi:BglG family transcription antiterminator [Liquorilactobacillus cacaonum]|uniref:LicABCH operon regulator n=1 Tax=Liquorilactobacillus cacaonum DSM 21116 TaxID=1423729 RepID=A0A0R2CFN9_9LACO|nr:BglG family transcription antiterminator [Liquorilactobacillus cacaonum]KRM90133.1 licABCH operon regulator [Liquorilactobacillus cacaonum DSM 21116]
MIRKKSLDAKDQEILNQMLKQRTIHYQNISESTGYSRKTIANHLNHIEEFLDEYNIELIRKRGNGIQIKGDVKQISMFKKVYFEEDEYTLSLLSKLIFSNHPLKVQELADLFFVSRTLIESKIKKVKPILDRYGIAIKIQGHEGLIVEGASKQKRKFAADLLYKFWNTQSDEVIINEEILSNILDKNLLEKIIKITSDFIKNSKLNFSDYEKESLIIHLAISFSRISEKSEFKKIKIPGVLNKETLCLVKKLEKGFKIKIPEAEKNYLDIHIRSVKAGMNEKIDTDYNSELSEFLEQNIDEYDTNLLNGLTLHLTPAIKRINFGLSIRNPLKHEIKKNFVRAYEEALKLSNLIQIKYSVSFDDDEVSYIALHFQAYFEREKSIFSVYLVCSSGLGTAQLLKQRLLQNFANQLEILKVLSNNEYQNLSMDEIRKADLVIATINTVKRDVPLIVVTPFLDISAIGEIKASLRKVTYRNKKFGIRNLITLDNIIIKNKPVTFEDAVTEISKIAGKKKISNIGLKEAILEREKISSTFYDEVGLPHATKENVKQSAVFVFISEKGIYKEYEKVNVLFFLLLADDAKHFINEFYEFLNDIVTNKKKIKKIIKATTKAEVIHELESIEKEGSENE